MTKRYGILITDDGSLLCVSVLANQHGWKLGKIRRWPGEAFMPSYLLLHRPVHLALQSYWIRQPDTEVADMVTCHTDNSFTACTNRPEYEHFSELLRNNLVATYPDDALLVTLPRYFHSKSDVSYLSVFRDSPTVKLGVVVDNQLKMVFSTKASTFRELSGFIERVRCYFGTYFSDIPFPSAIYLLNNLGFDVPSSQRVECDTDEPDVLKAMGVALCTDEVQAVPKFSGPSPESSLRKIRTAVLAGAIFIVLGTVAATSALVSYSYYFNHRVAAAKASYKNILNTNTDIRQLLTTGNDLSRKVLQMQKQAVPVTAWGPFLQLIGMQRPAGLFLERIGSEPVPGSISKIKLALGGWCETETVATDFIKLLNKSPILSEVTLSSMERIGNKQTTCRFKILCLLSTLEK